MDARGAAARFAWGAFWTLGIGRAYAAHPLWGAAASGLKEVLGALAAEAGASEEELGRRLQALGKKLEGLEIPRTKRDAVLATLEWLLFYYSDAPMVAGVRRDPRAYARAVLDAAGEEVPTDLRHEVERALLAFYEEAFQDEVLGRLLSSEALSRLAERLGEELKEIRERLLRLELELTERRVARVLERPWQGFGEIPKELSFRSLTARAGLVGFQPEVKIHSKDDHEILTFYDLLDHFQNLEPGLHISLIVGQGGAGKTRLGYELAKRLEEEGWMSRALREDLQAEWLSGLGRYIKKVDPRVKGVFLLLDYAADRKGEQYQRIVSQLVKLRTEVRLPIALLLIDRARSFAPALGYQFRPVANLGIHEILEGQKEWEIAELEEETARKIFFEACDKLKEQYPQDTLHALSPRKVWEDLKKSYPYRPLPLLLAAYFAVQGQPPATPRSDKLLKEALDYERRNRWGPKLAHMYGESGVLRSADLYPYLEVLIAGATLFNGICEEEALNFLRKYLVDRGVFTLAKSLFPLGESCIGPLEPDPIGDLLLRESWENPLFKELVKIVLKQRARDQDLETMFADFHDAYRRSERISGSG